MVMNWGLFLGASFGYKKIPSAFYRRLIIPGIRHQAAFTLPITQGLAVGEAESDILTESELKKYFRIFFSIGNDIFRMLKQLIVGDSY